MNCSKLSIVFAKSVGSIWIAYKMVGDYMIVHQTPDKKHRFNIPFMNIVETYNVVYLLFENDE